MSKQPITTSPRPWTYVPDGQGEDYIYDANHVRVAELYRNEADDGDLLVSCVNGDITEAMIDAAWKAIFAYNLRELDDMSIDDKIKYGRKVAQRGIEAAMKARVP